MLLPGRLDLLGREHLEVVADDAPGLGRSDNVVNVTKLRGLERVGKGLVVLALLGMEVLSTAEDNLRGTLGAHDSNLGAGPSVVAVALEMLRAHHDVGTTVGLTSDHGDLGDGGLGVSVEKLGTMADNTTVLLLAAGQVAGHVDEGHEGNIERVAEADKANKAV